MFHSVGAERTTVGPSISASALTNPPSSASMISNHESGVPSRGEEVAFSFPDGASPGSPAGRDSGAIVLKRCVATPGDSLRLEGGSSGTFGR